MIIVKEDKGIAEKYINGRIGDSVQITCNSQGRVRWYYSTKSDNENPILIAKSITGTIHFPVNYGMSGTIYCLGKHDLGGVNFMDEVRLKLYGKNYLMLIVSIN